MSLQFTISFILSFIGVVLVFAGWFHFCYLVVRPEKAKRATGKLTGFREYFAGIRVGKNSRDYPDNGPGRRPVVLLQSGEEGMTICCVGPAYNLTSLDVGQQVPVLYQVKLGIVAMIDDEVSLKKYKKRNVIGLVICIVTGAVCCVAAALI